MCGRDKEHSDSFRRKDIRLIGRPPGTLREVAADKAAARNSSGRYFRYNSDAYSEQSMEKAVLPEGFGGEGEVSWLDVTGINDSQLLRTIGNALSIHPLILEDIQNTDHRPKIETFPGYVLIIFKMLQWEPDSASVSSEQVSLILGKNFVLTFQERPGDVFEPVRDRIRRAKGRVRTAAADYLAYALLDVVTDRYFRLIEEFEDKMETIEDAIEDNIKSFDYSEIRELRRELIQVRRAVWPLRELIAAVSDSYHTNLNTSMNAVMKVLTVIATIFIPLTFLAGVYGMNFRFMPELQWRWGYFAVLGIMGLIGVAMFLYFKKKKWL